MTQTIWTLGQALRQFPVIRVDCRCGNVGFFRTQDVASQVGYARDPHSVPFTCQGCKSKSGTVTSLLEVDVDRRPRIDIWRPLNMGRNRPTIWMLERFR